MSTITDFKGYCDALHSGKTSVKRRRAELIRYLRDWMIRVQSLDEGKEEEKLGYVSNYEIFANALEPKGETPMDELSRIVENVNDACRRIGENFRSKILREVVLMPSHRARELDSTGLQWLACRSGRTIREKLAYTNNKLRAVRRRFSLDTGENRLFMAFLRRAKELIEFKGKSITKSERQFLDWSHKILYDEELDEIGMWGNTAPNNTLLSDKYYRTVWRAWQALEKLDDIVTADDEKISSNMCIAFFWKLLQCLSRYCRFCAQPVLYNYSDYVVKPWTDREQDHSSHVVGLSATGYIILDLDSGLSKISVETGEQRVTLKFNDIYLFVSLNGKKEGKYAVSVFDSESNFSDLIKKVIDLLHLEKSLSAIEDSGPNVTADYIYMDVFSVRPIYLTDSGKLGRLPRVLWQTFDGGYELAADEAAAIYVSDKQKMHSIRSCMVDNSNKDILLDLLDLFRIIRKNINGKSLSIPLPDAYNVFQTEPLRRVAHMNYKHVFFAPKSIAIVVYALSHRLLGNFSSGDFVIVVDCNLEELSLTLIQGKYNEMVYDVLPTSQGYVWERHPTVKEKLEPKNETIIPEEIRAIFGEKGLIDETGKLSFDLIHSWISIDNQIVAPLKNERTNIENVITKFKSAYRKVIANHNTVVLFASPQLFSGQIQSADVFSEATLFGLKTLMDWEQILSDCEEKENLSLPHIWSEHLPSLAIKRLYGSFSLIGEGNQMEPLLGKSQSIPIPSTFVLPKNQSDYRFGLIMGNDKDVAYEAVLRHRAFPLQEDVECNLDLTYTYGRDNPYELKFIPIGTDMGTEPPFRTVTVSWEPASERKFMGLSYPSFPPDNETWETLQHGSTLSKNNVNFLQWIENSLEKRIVLDLDDEETLIFRYDNSKWIYVLTEVDGEKTIVKIFDEDGDLENQEKIYCTLVQDKTKRERIYFGDADWRWTRNGDAYSYKEVPGIGNVAFYENNILFDEEAEDTENTWVSFEIYVRENDGKRIAKNILVEDENYIICKGVNVSKYMVNASVFYPLHKVFANWRSSKSSNCPRHFKAFMKKLSNDLPAMFESAYKQEDDDLARRLFRVICITAADMPLDIYKIASDVLESRPWLVDDDIGCMLGDYDNVEQQKLLIEISSSKQLKKSRIIKILGRAAWKSDGFIQNAPPHIILQYFDEAAKFVCDYSKHQKLNVMKSIEYLLAVFRLRSKGDAEINRRISLLNPKIRKLYQSIEKMIDEEYEILDSKSRIQMEVTQNSEFASKKISNLCYALLVYITGGEDEIKIVKVQEAEQE